MKLNITDLHLNLNTHEKTLRVTQMAGEGVVEGAEPVAEMVERASDPQGKEAAALAFLFAMSPELYRALVLVRRHPTIWKVIEALDPKAAVQIRGATSRLMAIDSGPTEETKE